MAFIEKVYFYRVKLWKIKIWGHPLWAFLWALFYFLYQWKGLNRFSLNGDEPFSVFTSQGEIGHIWSVLSQGNNPPLYETLLHFWMKIFGNSERAVRSLSLLAASITIGLVFDTLRRKNGAWAHLSIVLIFLSNYFQLHATEARGYSILMMLCVITTRMLYLAVVTNTKIPVLGYALCSLMLLYTHFFGWWILLTHLILIVSSSKVIPVEWRRVGWISLIILIGYIPYGMIFWDRLAVSAVQGTWLNPVTNMGSLHDFIFWSGNQLSTLYFVLILTCSAAVEMALQRSSKDRIYYWPIRIGIIFFTFFALSIYVPMPYFWEFTADWFWFYFYSSTISLALVYVFFISSRFSLHEKWMIGMWGIPLFVIFLISTKVPMYLDRYVAFCVPFFYITLAGILVLFWKKKMGIWSILVIGLFWLSAHQVMPEKRSVKRLVDYLKDSSGGEKTAIVICPYYFDLNFLYYWNREQFENWGKENYSEIQIKDALRKDAVLAIQDSSDCHHYLEDLRFEKILYLNTSADFAFPGNGISEYLHHHYHMGSEVEFPERFLVTTYER